MTLGDWVRVKLGPYNVARLKRWTAPVVARDLTRLGKLYGTNKAAAKQLYTPLYERHLATLDRRGRLQILEIGVGGYETGMGGSSLRMWRSYFPNAAVFGIDIGARDLREPRVKTFEGDQTDTAFLERVAREAGPFDLVVDDGSHVSAHIITSLGALWPHVKTGGWYVIEDTQTSYMPDFGGGPAGTPGTSLEFVKCLVDRVQDADELVGVHVYPRITFLQKG